MPITAIRLSAFSVALTTLALAAPAWCTEPSDVAATNDPLGYGYVFHDDPLLAGGFGPHDARLRVVSHAARDLLIRPRTQFIAEMLKSVENL